MTHARCPAPHAQLLDYAFVLLRCLSPPGVFYGGCALGCMYYPLRGALASYLSACHASADVTWQSVLAAAAAAGL